MAPKNRRINCQICTNNESKYTCSGCAIVYCSVPCFKKHEEESCTSASPQNSKQSGDSRPTEPGPEPSSSKTALPEKEEPLPEKTDPPLRPLTSLKWPYVPDQSAYPDPLKRNDPKPLQTPQYEAIATSPAIRKTLADHPRLPALLASLDELRGPEREDALQRALGIAAEDIRAAPANAGRAALSDDVLALRALAEAVESAVRGGKDGVLGLDWE
ncbi:hypothetical protein GGX14DRAFT_82599 [Mycena pura]|uniref:HIT-type domain-containing protein n=1 Tax=Mycena pura TaxID=153505 RepID=A0AAD6VHI2_9AGAR|nr:hypothetical protein GGX14DRAFT_82599 [Mycena pura]